MAITLEENYRGTHQSLGHRRFLWINHHQYNLPHYWFHYENNRADCWHDLIDLDVRWGTIGIFGLDSSSSAYRAAYYLRCFLHCVAYENSRLQHQRIRTGHQSD